MTITIAEELRELGETRNAYRRVLREGRWHDPEMHAAEAEADNRLAELAAAVSPALLDLQRLFYRGQLPRSAVLAQARVMFGFSLQESVELFPAEQRVEALHETVMLSEAVQPIRVTWQEARLLAEAVKDDSGHCHDEKGHWTDCGDPDAIPLGQKSVPSVHYHGPKPPGEGWQAVGKDEHGNKIWRAPPKQSGLLARLKAKLAGKKPDASASKKSVEAPATNTKVLVARQEASPAYQDLAKKLDAKHQRTYNDLAQQAGMSVPELQQHIAAKAQALADSHEVYVRVKPHILDLVLESGRLKNQLETGKSEDAAFTPELRVHIEDKGMGVHKDSDHTARPISGYLGKPDFEGASRQSAGRYGSVAMKLKPRVRARSTATFGDSAEMVSNEYGQATLLDQIGHRSVDPDDLKARGMDLLDSSEKYHAHKSFVEVQVHDGLSLNDVEEIGFPQTPSTEVQQKLKDAGLKWRVYGEQ